MIRNFTRSLLRQQPALLYSSSLQRSTKVAVNSGGRRSLLYTPLIEERISVIRHFSQNSLIFQQQQQEQKQIQFQSEEPKLSLTFTCTANECNHRSTHQFTKRSYEKGIVLVQCPSCKNRHLIADHLGWFTESKDEPKTVEQIVAANGGRIRKGIQYDDGKGYETLEILSDSNEEKGGSDGQLVIDNVEKQRKD